MVETLVNTTTQGDQSNAGIAALAGGGYVVVWQSQGQDDANNNFGIYAQRYDSAGNPVGAEFRINGTTAGDQTLPSVAALSGGGFVVTWTTPGQDPGDTDIHAQLYDSSGNAAGGEVRVNATAANPQDMSAVAGLSGGGYVVTWTSLGEIYAQKFDANGNALGVETQVNTYAADDQTNPAITALTGGGYVVTWQSYNQDGYDYGIYAQRYDASGNAVGGETHVSTYSTNIQANPTAAATADGGYVIAWQSYGQDGSQEGIYFQRYDANGTAQGGETPVNTTTASVQSTPSIAGLSGGGYIVTWQSYAQDGSAYGIYSRIYDAGGNPTTGETQLNTFTAGQQVVPVATALVGGGYAIAWQSYDQDGGGYGIYKMQVGGGGGPAIWTGTPGDDSFTAGTGQDWTISGLGGNDTLSGAGGNDTIDGGDGNDVIHGGGGRDTIHGGTGDDLIYDVPGTPGTNLIDGGDGNDTLDFSENGNAFAVNLSLANTAGQQVGGGFYSISGIENLTGANLNDMLNGDAQANVLSGGLGNDTLSGAGGNDTLNGGEGDDTLYGGPGDDVLDGGNGTDTASYFDAVAGVTVSLATAGPQNTGSAGMDTLIGIENLRGSEFDDTLTGDGNANRIVGGEGTNTIFGGGGNDTLIGGNGTDYIYDDSGDDTINGNGGNDVLEGRAGANILNGGDGDDLIQILGDGTNTIDGGAGFDSLAVSGFLRTSGMTIDLTSLWTTGSGTFDGNSYTGMESVVSVQGSDYDDYIYLGGPATTADVNVGDASDISGGGGGNDRIFGTDGANYLSGNAGNDNLSGFGGVDHLSGGDGDDLLDGGAGDDVLAGGAGNDMLAGGTGADTMAGGTGDDTYVVDNPGDTITEVAGEGVDTVFVDMASYTLGDNLENMTGNPLYGDLVLTGNGLANHIIGGGVEPTSGASSNDTLYGMGGDDWLEGLEGNDLLDGGTGADKLYGGAGDDTYVVDNAGDQVFENANEGNDTVKASVSFTLGANVENLVLTGTANINGYGNGGHNTITGNAGSNVLDGGGGGDTLQGGAGNDVYYIRNAGDTIVEGAGEGTNDTALATLSYTLNAGAQVERLAAADANATVAIDLTGNAWSHLIQGNAGVNTLTGGSGDDKLYGYGGNDRLYGAGGSDTLYGGTGNDTYVIDSAGDTIVENANEGTDTVEASISFDLSTTTNVENLTLTGNAAINGTGNTGDNVIRGNSAANVLNGGGGTDMLYGGAGDDTYVVGDAHAKVIELSGEGNDTVQASVSYSLAGMSNIETLQLTGTANIGATGNAEHNTLIGNAGSNVLDGGGGGDTLQGGAGNDVYYIRNAGDTIVEGAGEGTNDTVLATLSYTLNAGAQVERLAASDANATTAIDLTGNAYSHLIQGNNGVNTLTGGDGNDRLFGYGGNDNLYGGQGNDTLDGGTGTDMLYGGAGDDTYVVGDAHAKVIELSGEGNDIVQASVGYSLAGMSNIETLQLTGTANINATGNGEHNALIGNAGSNVLDGAGGGDTLQGGAGNDVYYVRNAGDTIVEGAGQGTADTVLATTSYTLNADAQVERLAAADANATTAIDLTGNAWAHLIQGNNGANMLTGGSGNDTLYGYGGNDSLFGGAGADKFVFAHGTGQDTVGDFVSGTDKLDLTAFGFASYQDVINATHDVGGNAVIDLGNGDQVTLTGVTTAQLHSGDFVGVGNSAAAIQMQPFALDLGAVDTWHGGVAAVSVLHG